MWDKASIAFASLAADISPFDKSYPEELRQIIADILEDQEYFDWPSTRHITEKQVESSYKELLDELADQQCLIDGMRQSWERDYEFPHQLQTHLESKIQLVLDKKGIYHQIAYRNVQKKEAEITKMRFNWQNTNHRNQQLRASELRNIVRHYTATMSKYFFQSLSIF